MSISNSLVNYLNLKQNPTIKMKTQQVVFKNCCFCINLRVGCFIIAYVELIISLMASLILVLAMATGVMDLYGSPKRCEISWRMFSSENDGNFGVITLAITAFLLVIAAMGLAFVFTFIVGLHLRKRAYIMVYFIYASLFVVCEFIVSGFVVLNTVKIDVLFLVFNMTAILTHLYFLAVVRSYYIVMVPYQRPRNPQVATETP